MLNHLRNSHQWHIILQVDRPGYVIPSISDDSVHECFLGEFGVKYRPLMQLKIFFGRSSSGTYAHVQDVGHGLNRNKGAVVLRHNPSSTHLEGKRSPPYAP